MDRAWRCTRGTAGLEKMEVHLGGGFIGPLRCFMPLIRLGGHAGTLWHVTILQKQSNLLKPKGDIWLLLTLLSWSPQSNALLPPHAQQPLPPIP